MKSARMYWVGAIVVVLGVVAAYSLTRRPGAQREFESTDDFLKTVHTIETKAPNKGAQDGFIPGTDEHGGQPTIVVEKATLDLGVVPHTKVTTAELPIRNTGNADLVITDIGTSCHCTEGVMAPGQNVIKPGGQGILIVSLHPERVPDGFGSHKQLSIRNNDPKHQVVTLDVISKVDPEFSITPDTVAFGDIAKGQTATKLIRVRQISDEPFEVTSIVAAHPDEEKKFELSFVKVAEGEWAKPGHVEYDVKVALAPTLGVGPFNSGIKIMNTCARKNVAELWVPVSANVTSFYKLSTTKLVIPATGVVPGKLDLGSFTVEADRPIEISDLSISEPLLIVTPKDGDKPNTKVFTIGLSPLASPGVRNGDVTFTITAGGEKYSETVPVQVVIPTAPK